MSWLAPNLTVKTGRRMSCLARAQHRHYARSLSCRLGRRQLPVKLSSSSGPIPSVLAVWWSLDDANSQCQRETENVRGGEREHPGEKEKETLSGSTWDADGGCKGGEGSLRGDTRRRREKKKKKMKRRKKGMGGNCPRGKFSLETFQIFKILFFTPNFLKSKNAPLISQFISISPQKIYIFAPILKNFPT